MGEGEGKYPSGEGERCTGEAIDDRHVFIIVGKLQRNILQVWVRPEGLDFGCCWKYRFLAKRYEMDRDVIRWTALYVEMLSMLE